MPSDFEAERLHMVATQVAGRDITDPRVRHAMRTVPRELFVDEDFADDAYADQPLPIECGQTISQPYIVALMSQALNLSPTDHVLEVGTGSGYGAAVLSRIAANVCTIERHEHLARTARQRFDDLGYVNISVHLGDGSLGLVDEAPFDAIMVTAAGPHVPPALLDQLADGGRLVMPVGSRWSQELTRVRRCKNEYTYDTLGPVAFVPLIGAQGSEG